MPAPCSYTDVRCTATAVFALHQAQSSFTGDPAELSWSASADRLIRAGLGWLALEQRADGAWDCAPGGEGDLASTMLCWCTFVADENWAAGAYDATLRSAERWLTRQCGNLQPLTLATAIKDQSGGDRFHTAAMLAMGALSGRLGPGKKAWDLVPVLPFERTALPLTRQIIQPALPLTLSIGMARHAIDPSRNRIARIARALACGRALKLLQRVQSADGAFLKSPALSGFVVMGLAATGRPEHPIVQRSVQYLIRSVRPDGAWSLG